MQVQNLAGSDQWDRVKKELRNELGDDVFSNWFGRVKHEETTGDAVRLSVPTRFLKTGSRTTTRSSSSASGNAMQVQNLAGSDQWDRVKRN